MKCTGIICGGMVLAVGMIATASADDGSAVISKSSLTSMGLGGMQSMSDREGLDVRGKGAFFVGFRVKNKFPFDIKKLIHIRIFDHKKFDHGKSFDHRSFDGHKVVVHNKTMVHHKNMGGGMIWQPTKTVWSFGGGSIFH